jgi:hypothetical protein
LASDGPGWEGLTSGGLRRIQDSGGGYRVIGGGGGVRVRVRVMLKARVLVKVRVRM